MRMVPFTFVPVTVRVLACQQSARRGPWGRIRVAARLAVWTLSPWQSRRLRAADSEQGRHARPRGSARGGNSQVKRVETAGNRRFSGGVAIAPVSGQAR